MIRPLRAEMRLLLLCARTRPDPDVERRIQDLVATGPDWTVLIRAALAHGVTPLLYRSLDRICRREIPAELLAALRGNFEDNRDRNAALTRELVRIVAALDRIGIAAVSFKGPLLAALAYGDLSLRRAGDLDLLVHDDDMAEACSVLLASGYREQNEIDTGKPLTAEHRAALRRSDSQLHFIREADGISVEPHWCLTPRKLAVSWDEAALWRRARRFPLGGGQILGLALEDVLLMLCVHGSKHEWAELRWICDLEAVTYRHPGLDWSLFLERSRAQGVERMMLLGLALANSLLESPLPPIIRERLAADAEARRLAATTTRLAFVDGKPAPLVGASRYRPYRRRMRERRRDQARYVFRTFTIPEIQHVRRLPLPPPLHFLHTPFKLVHDYIAWPAWFGLQPLAGWSGGTAVNRERRQARRRARFAWAAAAESWERWAADRAAGWEWVDELLFAAAEIEPAEVVLDLASGVGDPALGLARRLGDGGSVVATDLVPAMLVAARRRAREDGTGRLRFCCADLQQLPFAAGSFDRVVCRLGIMFSADLPATLAEARRVLRPGGRVAFLVWGARRDNTVLDVLLPTVASFFGQAYDEEQEELFRFSGPGQLAGRVRRAGFVDVVERAAGRERRIAEEKDFWRPQLELTCGALLKDLPPTLVDDLQENLRAAFARRLRETDGRVFTAVQIVSGRCR